MCYSEMKIIVVSKVMRALQTVQYLQWWQRVGVPGLTFRIITYLYHILKKSWIKKLFEKCLTGSYSLASLERYRVLRHESAPTFMPVDYFKGAMCTFSFLLHVVFCRLERVVVVVVVVMVTCQELQPLLRLQDEGL